MDVFITVEVPENNNNNNNSGGGMGTGKGKGKQRAPRVKRVRVGGSELHSSEKEGCLM